MGCSTFWHKWGVGWGVEAVGVETRALHSTFNIEHSALNIQKWAYPGFVDRLVFESGDSGLTLLKLNG
jgi:hypothetical protein